MPSLLKFVVRAALAELGDFKVEPLVAAAAEPGCDGTSIEKFSLFGSGNGLPELLVPPMESGESPVDEGDILLFGRPTVVDEAVANTEVMCILSGEATLRTPKVCDRRKKKTRKISKAKA
jgi:hypothetical protein